MDMKKYMKTLPAVAALLLTAACSNEDIETIDTPQPSKERIIHFTANVDNGAGTRATLDGTSYNFQSGDKLYVWGTNISGELTTTNSGTSATFTGDLTYTGASEPGLITLNAVVKGPSDQILGSFAEFKARGYVPSYTTGLASNKKDAVEKFSYLTASANCNLSVDNPSCDFGEPKQQSTFISFDITLEDGTAVDESIDVTIKNGGSVVRSGSVTTENDGDVVARFTAAFPGGTALSGATVTLGTRDAISFASSNPTLNANRNYTVTKSYGNYKMTVSATVNTGFPSPYDKITKSTEKDIHVLPYINEHTIKELLKGAGLEDVNVTSFEIKDGTNVTITNPSAASANDYILKTTAKGSAVFELNGSANVTFMTSKVEVPMPCDITFTVADKE